MKYELSIPDCNLQPHLDIEKDIQARKNGLFNFIIRVNNGRIVDYNLMEYISARQKYFQLERIIWTELTVAHHHGTGNQIDAVRPDDLQRNDQGRGGEDRDTGDY